MSPFVPTRRNYRTFGMPDFVDEKGIEWIRLRTGNEEDQQLVHDMEQHGDLLPGEELLDFRIPMDNTRRGIYFEVPHRGDELELCDPNDGSVVLAKGVMHATYFRFLGGSSRAVGRALVRDFVCV